MTAQIFVKVDPDLADLIPGFLANRRRDVLTLGELIESGDYSAIRIIGHSMKGAGGGYGFDLITDIGNDIEIAAQVEDLPKIREATARLAEYLACVEPVFE